MPGGDFDENRPSRSDPSVQTAAPQTRSTFTQKLLKFRLRLERFFIYYSMRLFRLRGSAEKIARGFAVGLIVNFFPTLGFGVFISGFVARLLGGNLLAGILGGLTLTFLWPFLFYLNMVTGGWVRGRMIIRTPEELTDEKMDALVWGQTFTTGAVLNSLVAGLLVYLLLYWLLINYRQHGLARLYMMMKRHQRETMESRSNGA
jgi:uncharacterized protein